jgi:hypothetical protein
LYGLTGADAMSAFGAPPVVVMLANDEGAVFSAVGATGVLALQATANNVDRTTTERRKIMATS